MAQGVIFGPDCIQDFLLTPNAQPQAGFCQRQIEKQGPVGVAKSSRGEEVSVRLSIGVGVAVPF